MNLQIREARTEDYTSIWKLSREQLGYDFPPDETRTKLAALLNRSSDKIFVAVQGQHVVGYVHACNYDVLYAPHMKNIMGIAVAAEWQKHGIGRMLLSAVEHWAQESSAAGVRLVSGETRIGAHAFYQQCGYAKQKAQFNFRKFL